MDDHDEGRVPVVAKCAVWFVLNGIAAATYQRLVLDDARGGLVSFVPALVVAVSVIGNLFAFVLLVFGFDVIVVPQWRPWRRRKDSLSCPICNADLVVAAPTTITLKCGDQFCRLCLQTAFDFDANRNNRAMTCPDCRRGLSGEELRWFVEDGRRVDSFEARCREFAALTQPGAEHCPTPDCRHVFPGATLKKHARQAVLCPDCRRPYCTKCRRQHGNGSCPRQKKPRSDLGAAGSRCPCPRCGAVVERTEGCPRMLCRCSTLFCFLCGQTLSGGTHKCKVSSFYRCFGR